MKCCLLAKLHASSAIDTVIRPKCFYSQNSETISGPPLTDFLVFRGKHAFTFLLKFDVGVPIKEISIQCSLKEQLLNIAFI